MSGKPCGLRSLFRGIVKEEYLVIIMGYFFLFISEALLMSTHNICFYGAIRKISTIFGSLFRGIVKEYLVIIMG